MEQIKACGYIRVSTSIQASEGESLDTQRKQIIDFIKQKGWKLTEIYADEGLSGAKAESRPQLQQMKEDAKEGEFSLIVFTKLSRFARNAREYMNLSFELEQYGVQLASVKENIDPTTRTGKMIAGILSLFAEWEHETIHEQMNENKMIRWKEKRTFIGRPPFGYTWNKEKKELEVVPEEVGIYNEIVNMYTEQALPMRDIAIKLNARGLKCKRKTWASGTISYLLKNPCYYGHYVVNQYEYEDGINGAGTKRTNKKKPASQAIEFPIPAIITKTEWDEIQEMTDHKKSIPKHATKDTMKFILRNVLVCGRCGSRMNSHMGSKRKDGSFLRYYCCYYSGTSKKSLECGRQKCTLPHIKAERLENEIWVQVLMMFSLNPKKVLKNLYDPIKFQREIDNLTADILRLNTELQSKEVHRSKLYDLLEKPSSDVDEVNQRLLKNKDEKLTIESNLAKKKEELKAKQKQRDADKSFFEFINTNKQQLRKLHGQVRNLDYPDRKLLVEAMMDKPMVVDYAYADPNHPEDGGDQPIFDYKLHFNTEIIKRFIEEGKIVGLNPDSPDYLNIIKEYFS